MISHGILPILPNLYFFTNSKTLSMSAESLFFGGQKAADAKLSREMAMGKKEMVLEKSWKNMLSRCGSPGLRTYMLLIF